MRRIVIKEARPGMVIARSVRHPADPQTLLAAGGDVLSLDPIVNFHELGLYDLWVHDPGLDFLDDICASQTTKPQQRLAEGLRTSLLRLWNAAPIGRFKRFDSTFDDLFRSLLKDATAVPHFAALTEDEILLAHSCDVAVLSILLGLNLEEYLIEQRKRLNCRQARDVLNLAIGALFHDVGELVLPAHQRESFAGRSPESDAWKQHTDEGYAIVRGHIEASAAAIVQHHHQHFDGTGFAGVIAPGGPLRVQNGAGIHVFARIVAAAEIFCRHQGSTMPQPIVKTLWQIQQAPLRKAFDPVIHNCLLQLFPPFVEGMVVTMADGRQAVVRRANSDFPCYPVASVVHGAGDAADETIDTADGETTVAIVDGTHVGDFLYGTHKERTLAAA